jgi:hypothetical protein
VSVTYNPTPTGSSVTPVNNVRNWLDSAKVFDKNYTTISQVLSDTTTLQTLISSNNANDYLVRSTSWVSDICGNSTAMSYIGLNNYSANTLLADSTWCTGICNSTYFESVLNVKIPTMTSNTTPSGNCSCSYVRSDRAAYNAFDGETTPTYWISDGQGFPQWVQYTFPSNISKIFKCEFRCLWKGAGSSSNTQNQTLSYSSDGTNFTDFWTTGNVSQGEELHKKDDLSLSDVKAIRLTVTASTNSPSTCTVSYLQVYGRKDV